MFRRFLFLTVLCAVIFNRVQLAFGNYYDDSSSSSSSDSSDYDSSDYSDSSTNDYSDSSSSDRSNSDGNGCSDYTDLSRIDPSQYSTPEQCARKCVKGEPRRICYYHFTVEQYVSMGAACDLCTPNITNQLSTVPQCECVYGDGFEKTIFSINRMLPGPSIQVCENDAVIVDVLNVIEGVDITIHWHGIFQKGFQYFDGVPYITQCPIVAENTFRYQFCVNNAGTHFYHSHVGTNMFDGIYGSLIVRKPGDDLYGEDPPANVMLISDTAHELSLERFPGRIRSRRGQAPDNFLINGLGKWTDPTTNQTNNIPYATFNVQRGKRYCFHFINSFSTVCPTTLTIENHSLMIVATDGEDVKPVNVTGITSASGERVKFCIAANQDVRRYWIHLKGLGECGDKRLYQLAVLIYDDAKPTDISSQPTYDGLPSTVTLNPLNATQCTNPTPTPGRVCYNQMESTKDTDKELLKVEPDLSLIIFFLFYSYNGSLEQLYGNGSYHSFYVSPNGDEVVSLVSNISFKNPQSPLISQKEGYGRLCPYTSAPSSCVEPCTCTHVYNVSLGAIVEIVLWDAGCFPGLSHPFHLHGFTFYVFDIGQIGCQINQTHVDNAVRRHKQKLQRREYSRLPAKDTLMVPTGGYTIIRFRANNPGWWLFHCHFTWHTISGMDAVFHVGKKGHLPPKPRNFPKCNSWKA